jgi:hypothetical protein
MTIKLFTRKGECVTDAEIPVVTDRGGAVLRPDVIHWDGRLFVPSTTFRHMDWATDLGEDEVGYVEATTYALPLHKAKAS